MDRQDIEFIILKWDGYPSKAAGEIYKLVTERHAFNNQRINSDMKDYYQNGGQESER